MIGASNSSPLVTLSKLDCLDLLNRLFHRLMIPAEVFQEVVAAGKERPGAAEVSNSAWIERMELRDPGALSEIQSQSALGAGESSAILLAKDLRADLVLLDDRQARNFARKEGLTVMGTVGLLEALYLRGHLSDLREIFARLLLTNAYIDKRLLDRRLKSLGLLPL